MKWREDILPPPSADSAESALVLTTSDITVERGLAWRAGSGGGDGTRYTTGAEVSGGEVEIMVGGVGKVTTLDSTGNLVND